MSRPTQALPAQSTHSSSSPESSDAADPTQPLAKAADTATRGPTPQWHRLRSSKGNAHSDTADSKQQLAAKRQLIQSPVKITRVNVAGALTTAGADLHRTR